MDNLMDQSTALLRCKVRVSEVVHVKNPDGTTGSERVTLCAVYGQDNSENAKWSKWTPSANFSMTINNPSAMNKLSRGHEFFVDFIPAPPPQGVEGTHQQ